LSDGGIVYFYPQHQDRYFGQPSLLNGYRRHFLRGKAGVNITTIQCLGYENILLHI